MIPFAAIFRSRELRINEYGRKTFELGVGDVSPRLHDALTFAQHLFTSWIAALPLLVFVRRIADPRLGVLAGATCEVGLYVVLNSWALPFAFGDPTPWQLGFDTVYPSLVLHLVYSCVLALFVYRGSFARPRVAP
jgi:hypothetical protein